MSIKDWIKRHSRPLRVRDVDELKKMYKNKKYYTYLFLGLSMFFLLSGCIFLLLLMDVIKILDGDITNGFLLLILIVNNFLNII